MKIPKYVVTLAVALSGCSLTPAAMAAVTIDIGSGPETSYFVLESQKLGTRTYNIHYGGATPAPADGYALFKSILGTDPTIRASVLNFGSAAVPNYIVNDISFNDGIPEVNTAVDPWSPSWTHWVADGGAGFPSASPIAAGTWINGSGLSAPYRTMVPGSWDALVYSDYVTAPSIAPVPEPSGAILTGLAALAIVIHRKRSAR
jgi:hypothetical protein